MTWGAPLTFGRNVGKVTTTQFRMTIVRNGSKLGVCIVIPGVTAAELGWTAETSVDLSPGEGTHTGWLRLSPSQSPGARRLRTTGKSANLRLVTPMWPWLIGRGLTTRALEVVENRKAHATSGAYTVDVRLPVWACPETYPAARAEAEPHPPTKPREPPNSPSRRLLDTMPHPLSPGLPQRRIPQTQQERAATNMDTTF